MSVSVRVRLLLWGTLLALAPACGEDGAKHAPILGGDGDGDGDGDGGAGGVNPSVDMGGPDVTVMSPTVALDPAADDVVVGTSWKVQCQVTQKSSGNTIDTGAILAVVMVNGNSTPVASVPALSEGGGNVFAGSVPLTDVPHGRVYVGCLASDVDERTNLQVVDTFYDRGPKVEIKTPIVGQFLKKTAIPIVVKIGVARLTDGDSEAGVQEIKALVNGDLVRLDAVAESPGEYAGQVDLTNDDSPPAELAIEISATNKRTPTPATNKVLLAAPVDATPPTIVITKPVSSEIVGNGMVIEATVDDPDILAEVPGSGVDYQTVKAVLEGADINDTFDMERDGDTYSIRIPNIEKYVNAGAIQLTVNVSASDRAGNQTQASTATGIVVYPDTVPPFVSLDPPLFREAKKQTMGSPMCSVAYDPLGTAVPNDGDKLSALASPIVRVLAWDRAVQTETFTRYSHVVASTVTIHSIDGDQPLLMMAASGKCDIQPNAAATKVDLKPIAASESHGYRWTRDDADSDPTAPFCASVPDETADTAKQLCSGASDMWRVLRHEAPPEPSVVYGVDPSASGPDCTGNFYQLSTTPGWKCIVATASDARGNASVSAPLRLCVDDGAGACDADPPSCTDGCELDELFTTLTGNPRVTDVPLGSGDSSGMRYPVIIR